VCLIRQAGCTCTPSSSSTSWRGSEGFTAGVTGCSTSGGNIGCQRCSLTNEGALIYRKGSRVTVMSQAARWGPLSSNIANDTHAKGHGQRGEGKLAQGGFARAI
jgi:hypothetical protein